MRKIILILVGLLFIESGFSQQEQNRWKIKEQGSITWLIKDQEAKKDHIEMSGKYISAVIRYGVNPDHSFYCSRDIVWPMLRTLPNNTHASLTRSFNQDLIKMISINKRLVQEEKLNEITLNGTIIVKSELPGNLSLTRTIFPSTDRPAFCEKYKLINNSKKPATIEIPEVNNTIRTDSKEGLDGSYTLKVLTQKPGTYLLQPNDSVVFYMYILGIKQGQDFSNIDVENELTKRIALLSFFSHNLILETPDSVLNVAFAFAKIRASESIYQTKGGPMHGPGGLSYYAAIWANDQAEYVNPFFPYLGYDYGIESALNAYRHFARFMNPEFKPIPSSIIAEGTDVWKGAGDRGDAAMIAYGATRFALSQGDPHFARELWPLIEWCLEYNKRKLNPHGVVSSDSDELEGRFPAGKANLSTSSLYYDALISAGYLAESLHMDKKKISEYQKQAVILRKNIETYFGAKVMGFDTYRYYEGNDILRAWICLPLTVNIFDRKQGTIDALFSPELWTPDGLASQSGDKTFWDRSTLYALRGVLAAGDTKRGLKYLQYYSTRRLLGEHVPYPVEAYPEGNQRHLSAESGLYCRIFTEGMFGIRPVALNAFNITPQLPDNWDYMRLRKVHAYGSEFDIDVKRESGKIRLTIIQGSKLIVNKLIENRSTLKVRLITT